MWTPGTRFQRPMLLYVVDIMSRSFEYQDRLLLSSVGLGPELGDTNTTGPFTCSELAYEAWRLPLSASSLKITSSLAI